MVECFVSAPMAKITVKDAREAWGDVDDHMGGHVLGLYKIFDVVQNKSPTLMPYQTEDGNLRDNTRS